uniref:Adenylosuccinate synthetase n=1 Tax=candidate division WWE3 bacterium TaxID=2053526 RepID=A0A832E0L9_UNCKA
MGVTVVVGAQWGDEGKGKIVDLLARNFDYVVRFHGGPNAGHTVKVGERTLKLHHIPSAVLREDCTLVIANGVVVDPQILLGEIAALREQGIELQGRLVISKDCHLILPYHRMLEGYFASLKEGKMDTRSTGRGIGPSHADKVQYLGIKVADLFYDDLILREKLRVNLAAKQAMLGEQEELRYLPYELGKWTAELAPFVGETVGMLHQALDKGARILMEGAQGTFLDVDHGFYPFVTASNAVAGAINAGAGIPPRAISFIWGVAKAYVTRVGDSPFPTEITGRIAQAIQERGGERGTTTGRLRKVGWFDAEMVRAAAKLSGFDALALTKIDVLSKLPQLQLATGTRTKGSYQDLSYLMERNPEVLFHAEPQYVSFEPWQEDLTKIRNFAKLPWRVTDYIEAVEQLTDVPVRIVSVGPEREQTIFR